MQLSQNEGIEGKTVVVTGGLGFAGSALWMELVRRGVRQVRAFDLRPTSPWSDDLNNHGVHCIQGLFPEIFVCLATNLLSYQDCEDMGDLTRKEDVDKALRGADCVFHLASYGMSGKEMLQFGRVDEVNVNGTCLVLQACLEFEIRRLVYVSTYNVVFGGKEIVNGNESLSCFPIDDHVDPYGRSKSIAEQLVPKHNARPYFKKNNRRRLYTCVIRPAAIYGPGWVYVDNLLLALILASMGLLDDIPNKRGHPVAAGQPYFIPDGSPINSFEFLRPLLRSLDYDLPKASLSVAGALLLGRIFWAIYTVLYPWLSQRWLTQPLILPAEVYKVGVTHYFSFLKAKEELGYVPVVSPQEGMAATISYWQERKRKPLDGPTIYARLFVVIGITSLFSAAYLPDTGPVPLFRALNLFVFRSMWVVRTIFLLAVAAHIGEVVYAWHLVKKGGSC